MVSQVIARIEDRFGKMTVTRGKSHNFVGMDIEFMDNNTVEILMKGYIEECIVTFGEDLGKGVNTPAKHDLFNVSDDDKMSEERMDIFHHIVAKLLYVSKRARVDIDLAVSFLCTRVSCSTEEDWTKLRRLLTYLQGTIDMPRVVGASGIDLMETYVDASYAVHQNMRGHTGGLVTLGRGIIKGKASKQKLNTKSSTETEVVGASDFIPWTVWAKRFLAEQGYTLRRNIFYQDNKSAMKMESNGLRSCGEKSRHIHIRYFFIKDILKRENIELVHCSTERMIADYYTKPLQGSLFRKMRDIIMGLIAFPDEERVGLGEKGALGEEKVSVNLGASENCNSDVSTKIATDRPPKSRVTYADAVRTVGG